VRTLDAGSDKPVPFVGAKAEANPALGVRGYRIDRVVPSLLDDQLRAIALAAAGLDVDLRVMGPMISTVAEAEAFVARVHDHGIASAGVMVEVPALALCADELMKVVDFISIGTNDLSQYALAACRTLGELSDLLDPWQPGLLRLMAAALGAARDHGVPAGVCGEAAGDETLACVLVGMGARSLSMSGAALPVVRAALAGRELAACEAAAEAALRAVSADEARAAAQDALSSERLLR
jgi:phosphoenolpyruvate-protein kinase (PTS system EI component)